MNKRFLVLGVCIIGFNNYINAQLSWTNVDTLYQPLPPSVHVYKTIDSLDGKPNVAYYISADLTDKKLVFSVDTTQNRRLTPSQFYDKNQQPLVVVNTTFFSFDMHQSLNTVIKNGNVVGHLPTVAGRGKDTLQFHHTLNSVIGLTKKRKADIAWVYTDSSAKYAYALQQPIKSIKTATPRLHKNDLEAYLKDTTYTKKDNKLNKWKMEMAVGGGPVLLQEGKLLITNNEERKFGGKAILDKHPRTAIGYTRDNKLIILVIQGRMANVAEGASLIQEAEMLRSIGCWEAMNLDGGGSSCLLINGNETIAPSDKKQRAVPAVFMIQKR
jgi:hypothetical protein